MKVVLKTLMKKGVFFPVLLLALFSSVFSSIGLYGEVSTTVSLTALSGVTDMGSEAGIVSYLYGNVSFKSKGNRNVRANLQIDVNVSDRVSFDVSRAFIKVRFPLFRVTLGKTRLSWGEGFFFNAGDVLFEGVKLNSDISGNSSGGLRGETVWLADVYFPLGAFSFLEVAALPFPEDNIQTGSGSSNGGSGISSGISSTGTSLAVMPPDFGRVAGRLVTKLSGVKLEGGVLYKSDELTPYASIQGHLILDWSASGRIPFDLSKGDSNSDFTPGEPVLSIGTFGMWRMNRGNRLSLRLESRLLPQSLWEEAENTLPGVDPGYALFLYGELSLALGDSLNYYLRSLVSPVDKSGLLFGGVDWNIYQGFNLMVQTGVQVGDSNDVWGWGRFGDIAFLTGLRFKY